MITAFQASGASAGTANWSKLLRTPTTSPDKPSSSTIGKRICARRTVRSVRFWSKPGAKSGMIRGASSTNSAVSTPSTTAITNTSADATRNASARLRFSSCSVNTGTNAAWSAASAKRLRTRFGTWNAIVNALIGPFTPK
jgi:hypothetical protein